MVSMILLASFFLFTAAGFPIAVALGISTLVGLMLQPNVPLVLVAQRMFTAMDSFPLMALPLFLLAGALMGVGGISRRIINLSAALVGHITGGLAHVSILASMIFAGISGSAVADTAGIGGIMIPSMIEKKYPRQYAAAVTAAASTIGVIIPPSIPMVICGAMVSVSVGGMFLGGVVPGVIIGLALMAVAYYYARREGYARYKRASLKEILAAFRSAFWAVTMPVAIVGGIVGGVFTPTEAGAVAVLYALVIGTLVYKELTFKDIVRALWDSALSSAKILFIIGTASLFAWLLTADGFPQLVGRALLSTTKNPTVMMFIISGILLVVGTFMESIAALILLMPVLFPISQQLGIDSVYFGVIVVIALAIGLVTPPVGVCLYVATDISRLPLGATSRALVPFIAVMMGTLILFLLVPDLILALPRLLMR
ncbi:MAG: TRAP transporter large permease [Firmicutes bacterium]|nr:TRAP transporter large permease [Bacillota bacterium]